MVALHMVALSFDKNVDCSCFKALLQEICCLVLVPILKIVHLGVIADSTSDFLIFLVMGLNFISLSIMHRAKSKTSTVTTANAQFLQCMSTQKRSFVSKFLLSMALSLKLFTLENPSITCLLSQIDDPFLPSGALRGATIFHLQTGMMLTA